MIKCNEDCTKENIRSLSHQLSISVSPFYYVKFFLAADYFSSVIGSVSKLILLNML